MDAPESQNQMQPPRKRPKTQGDLRVEVQKLHIEVLELEKENANREGKPFYPPKKTGASSGASSERG